MCPAKDPSCPVADELSRQAQDAPDKDVPNQKFSSRVFTKANPEAPKKNELNFLMIMGQNNAESATFETEYSADPEFTDLK